MQLRVRSVAIEKASADLLIVPVWKGLKQQPEFQELNELWDGGLLNWLNQIGFEGNKRETAIVPSFGKLGVAQVLLLGLGDRKRIVADDLRLIGGAAYKKAKELHAKHVALLSEPFLQSFSPKESASTVMEGWYGATYAFHAYHEEAKQKESDRAVQELLWIAHGSTNAKAIEKGADEAKLLSQGVHVTRDLVNTIAHEMTPKELVKIAQEIADSSSRLSITVLDQKEMEKKKMGAALAVARGAVNKPYTVHLVYKPKKKAKKRIAIVGKGVTFDTGGLSLKPSDGMVTMKMDMAGAAAVLGLFKVLPSLDLDIEVHGTFIAVENAISAEAYRPGDVVTAMDGTTIDIQNTDAEGRVVLADALLYAREQEPHALVDLATLTGACIVALGEEIAGVMGTDARLIERLKKASVQSGEDIWELPLPDKYADHVKSRIANIKNVGAKGQAGAIAGGLFLKRFAGDTPWAHLDIAGPAWTDREMRPDQSYGGTGFGVKLLVRYLQGL